MTSEMYSLSNISDDSSVRSLSSAKGRSKKKKLRRRREGELEETNLSTDVPVYQGPLLSYNIH